MRELAFANGEGRIELVAHGHGGEYGITLGEDVHGIAGARRDGDVLSARIDGGMRRFHVASDDAGVLVHDGNQRLRLRPEAMYRRLAASAEAVEHRVRAPMPGRVVLVQARPGDAVAAGDVVMVIEAMKMELALKAPRDGVVAEVRAQVGEFVEGDAVLATLEP